MPLSRYLLGLALLIVVLGAAGFGAARLRAQLLATWTGAPARLAEAILGLGIVLGVAEVLGILSLLSAASVVGGCLVVAALIGALTPRTRRLSPSGAGQHVWFVIAAFAVGALILGHWATGVDHAFHGGMVEPDTIGYHGPIAATFAQLGSIVTPPDVFQDTATAFYPHTSELLHALGILLFSRDVLSPLINLGWVVLILLAAWCAGRSRGVPLAAVLIVAVLVDLPVMSVTQSGSGDNDAMGYALLVSSLALLFTTDAMGDSGTSLSPAVAGVAGLAAGLSLGTKASFVAPIALLTLGLLIFLPSARTRLAWVLSVFAGGGFWFVRNLFAFGNPLPTVHLGPLPAAAVRGATTVADLVGHRGVVDRVFLPGLHTAFGVIWPVILGAAVLGVLLGFLRGPTRLDRILALVAAAAAVIYVFTPRSADLGGVLFGPNLRYLLPAIIVAVLLLVRSEPGRRFFAHPVALVLLAAGLVVDLAHSPSYGLASAWVAALSLALVAAWWAARRVRLPAAAALGAVGALGLILWPAERGYLNTRYTRSCEMIPCGPLAFAQSAHEARIAVSGLLGPYLLYGRDLSNRVVDIKRHGPHGNWTPLTSCRAWRQAINAGRYQYVVTSPAALAHSSATSIAATEWTRADPSARVLSVTLAVPLGKVTVFKLTGPLHPGACNFPG